MSRDDAQNESPAHGADDGGGQVGQKRARVTAWVG